ncbi:S-layer homology domain-containing protein [Aneurinibacillus tyrosinisolvens]|uniref:S-layer homology domain-containing protein n=1 Tax=Aneurinibacillus tyrosinisolvens TaxID=1443435 RepID=UPI00063F7E40|nr:S-layer homology domain-containing protein [Aneurinibacillus tyrosinisolvens]
MKKENKNRFIKGLATTTALSMILASAPVFAETTTGTAGSTSSTAGTTAATGTTGTDSFRDIDTAGPWAKEAITQASAQGLMNGDTHGNFNPLDTITREQMAAALVKIMRLNETKGSTSSYSDVPAGWSRDAIEAVTMAGYMHGVGKDVAGKNKFNPTANITREELAGIITNVLSIELKGKGDKIQAADKNTVSDWARPAVQAVMEKGLLNGDGTNFFPKKTAQRQEIAAMALRINSSLSTPTLKADDITVTNNPTTPDTVAVKNLRAGDTVKVYSALTGGNQLGSATATNNGTATVNIPQLGETTGNVYVTVTYAGRKESTPRIEKAYTAEQPLTTTAAPSASNITVTNNATTSDTITVTGLKADDIVKVYDAAKDGKLLGEIAKAQPDGSGSYSATVTVEQLSNTLGGTIYVTVTSAGSAESTRVAKGYPAEPTASNAPAVGDISITNNDATTADTITVNNLASGDVVKVYDAAAGGNLLGSATATAPAGSTSYSATVNVGQLSTVSNRVFVTVTSNSRVESTRVEKTY